MTQNSLFPRHIYIHWPFCKSKCFYCDFVSFQNQDDLAQAYHRALCREIQAYAAQSDCSNGVKTIFLGGGTPSRYPLALLQDLFATMRKNINDTALEEVTIECNPSDITEENLQAWTDFGISRLSIGIQILDDVILQRVGRAQTVYDALRALDLAPKYFNNISVDLILGLPGVDRSGWLKTLERVLLWQIQHVSVYFLTIHEKTRLYFMVQQGTENVPHDALVIDMYKDTVTLLERCGFEQYEISNFAKQGYASVHNQAYWDRVPYKGFGLGAHSFDGIVRTHNENNVGRYVGQCMGPNGMAIAFEEKLTSENEFLELLMLGLRQKKGFDLHHVVYFLHGDRADSFVRNVERLIQAGFIEQQDSCIRATVQGMIVENELVTRLLSV